MAHSVLPSAYSCSSNTSGPSGMAHAHRTTTLPLPGSHLGTRDIYSSATPSFQRRQPDHHFIPRSPSFPTRRPHISPASSPASFASLKMDASYGSKSQQNIPPLGPVVSHGHLSYIDSPSTPIKVDIHGVIDKGFFMAENEWTCYRRNYFSCVCSYSISPLLHNVGMQFVQTGSQQVHNVYGFAMCISAVVAENENHAIELVQHTPKRDKGPVAKPEKVRLSPKPQQTNHHPMALYGGPDGSLGPSRGYEQGFGQGLQNSSPIEHTFERIQFKQATANNGKRRAAQQYYHLIVELWADVGPQGGQDSYIKIAHKKSAKMIVRGRSPGHYQSERRGSTSSGPGGSAGSGMGGNGFATGFGSGEYSTGPSIMQAGYPSAYETRGGGYGGARHHPELTMEPIISAEEVKAITEHKGYQYYPATIYEGDHHHRSHQVELFNHRPRHDTSENGTNGSLNSGYDHAKVKPELENGGLPSIFYQPNPYYECTPSSRFDGKSTSAGHYPTLIPPSTSI